MCGAYCPSGMGSNAMNNSQTKALQKEKVKGGKKGSRKGFGLKKRRESGSLPMRK